MAGDAGTREGTTRVRRIHAAEADDHLGDGDVAGDPGRAAVGLGSRQRGCVSRGGNMRQPKGRHPRGIGFGVGLVGF